MSKNVAMFVDVANLYYAARGQDVDVDYVALLKYATKGRDLIRAYAYSGLDPENENQRKFIDFLGKNGYRVLTKDIRKFGDGRVKANLDIELVVDLFRLRDRMDIAVIVSGDGDFAPAIRALQDEGVRCEVISFKPNTSSDLIAVADDFIDIQKIAGIGRRKEGEKGMSAPEMPAKEVSPEFGFREASPSIAAAALAAIKGGNGGRADAGRGNGRRRGRPTAAAAPQAAAAEPTVAERPATADDGRRRRRRRGGRGRGRGRAAEAAAVPGTSEVAWEELDDLSELDGLGEEREYTFAEADAETLRELGLLDAGSVAAAVEEAASAGVGPDAPSPQAERPRARRRRATTTAASESAAAEPAVDEAEAAKPRRTRRTRTATKDAASAAGRPASRRATRATPDAEAEEPRATPRRRTRRSSASAEPGDEPNSSGDETPPQAAGAANEEAPQGIWGRFRAGRRPRAG